MTRIWVEPVDQSLNFADRHMYHASASNLFPTREDAVTAWVTRLKKTEQSVAEELAKWSDIPGDAEILAWVEEHIKVDNWPFRNRIVFQLAAISETPFVNKHFREVAIQCIREKKAG